MNLPRVPAFTDVQPDVVIAHNLYVGTSDLPVYREAFDVVLALGERAGVSVDMGIRHRTHPLIPVGEQAQVCAQWVAHHWLNARTCLIRAPRLQEAGDIAIRALQILGASDTEADDIVRTATAHLENA